MPIISTKFNRMSILFEVMKYVNGEEEERKKYVPTHRCIILI